MNYSRITESRRDVMVMDVLPENSRRPLLPRTLLKRNKEAFTMCRCRYGLIITVAIEVIKKDIKLYRSQEESAERDVYLRRTRGKGEGAPPQPQRRKKGKREKKNGNEIPEEGGEYLGGRMKTSGQGIPQGRRRLFRRPCRRFLRRSQGARKAASTTSARRSTSRPFHLSRM